MANRIKCNLALQISQHLNDFKFSSDSLKVYSKDKRMFIRLSTDDPQLPNKINDISQQLDGVERVEIKPAGSSYRNVNMYINNSHLIKSTILESISPTFAPPKKPKRVIVEYSSPNIAKPFHMGHLRSTIIGNFIANSNLYLGEDVTRLNYLGDWGTQFGILKVGVDICKLTPETLRNNPIESLTRAYVKANKLAESDNNINIKARHIFNEMEMGRRDYVEEWNAYRNYTIEELKAVYSRLRVTFDEYHWESMYGAKVINSLIDELNERGLIKLDDEGRKVVVITDRHCVPLIKSDGSSLYFSRDLAAVLDRHNKYNFDEMLYVVDNAQTDHFNALFSVLKQTKPELSEKCKHVKFGRVKGMSTRKGNVILLSHILDEATERIHERRKTSKYTKGDPDNIAVSEVLGVTSVMIYDLKQRRMRGYEFSWENALQDLGNTGIRLQYTHCRLCSIQQNATDIALPLHCDPNLLVEPEALFLILELARFDHIANEARREMEPCILVLYLFTLCNVINSAIGKLRVKDQPKDVAAQRLLLFGASKIVLRRGLELLGVMPLDEM